MHAPRCLSLPILVCFALGACNPRNQASNNQQESAPDSTAGLKGIHRDFRGKAEPGIKFNDPNGRPVQIASFKGKPVLVNLWASWCSPCVKELPTLDELARSRRIRVVAISEDNAPHASVVAFLQAHGIATLMPYQDPNMGLAGSLGQDAVLPTSILFDSNGKEVWRYIGDRDWTSSDSARLLAEAADKSG